MDISALALFGMVAYATVFILSVLLMILSARFLISLNRLTRTLNDYWRMRAGEQYRSQHAQD